MAKTAETPVIAFKLPQSDVARVEVKLPRRDSLAQQYNAECKAGLGQERVPNHLYHQSPQTNDRGEPPRFPLPAAPASVKEARPVGLQAADLVPQN